MSCSEDNCEHCQDTNTHWCDRLTTVCDAQIATEKSFPTSPSAPSLFTTCKETLDTPLAWCFQSELLTSQSFHPRELETLKTPEIGDDGCGSPENSQIEKSMEIGPPSHCSFISDVEEDSLVSGMSSVSLRGNEPSSASQVTVQPDQTAQCMGNFRQSIFESTMNLMKYRLNYPSLLKKSRRIMRLKASEGAPQSLGTFAEEVLRKWTSKDPPKSIGKPGVIANAMWFIKHQWKCRYFTLLDAIDLLYKDYQLLHHVSLNPSQRALNLAYPERLIASYSENLLPDHNKQQHIRVTAGADPVSYLASRISEHVSCPQGCVWPHRFKVSVCFVLDIIAQCRILRAELNKMCEFRDRTFRLTTQVRDQRDRLRKYIAEQRASILDVSQALAEVRNCIEHIQRGPPVQIQLKGNPLGLDKSSSMENEDYLPSQRSLLLVLETVLKEVELKRRHMHNHLQEITGNIRVFCRVRPKCPVVKDTVSCIKVTSADKLIICPNNIPETTLGRASTLLKSLKSASNPEGFKCFIFDRVFGPDASQEAVYKEVDDSIISCVDGFNVCIMAYGQTGSGKTYTMVGTAQNPGVNRRAIQRLLQLCDNRKHWHYQLSMSMLEVYQEEVFDLLAGSSVDRMNGVDCVTGDSKSVTSVDTSGPSRRFSPIGFMTSTSTNSFAHPRPSHHRRQSMVRLLSTREDELVLQNLTENVIESEEDVLQLLEIGEKRRITGSTRLNTNSSRSHMLLLLRVTGQHTSSQAQSRGTLILADLAGSENVSKSGSTGRRFQEATCINKSLSSLGRVFDSLRKHMKPAYRETKLTYLLKPTLGGDAKCLVLVNVRSEPENLDETLRAIKFGQGALQVAPWKSNSFMAPEKLQQSVSMPSNVSVRSSPKMRSTARDTTTLSSRSSSVRRRTRTPVP